ncbi:MAG: sulfite exporter TauE/SafE family protein [Porticoccaceae bacterium]|nr:sulfite exporter TauE/SafE family protein [Porticoccaceae bacterium]
MDILYYILAGAGVGLAIGLTGVGGGSLMTPLLIMFGFPYNVAIGTDLLYAAITKAGGMVTHTRQKTVQWRTVGFLAAGSVPASLVTAQLLSSVFTDSSEYQGILTRSLGVMLVLTATVILLNGRIRNKTTHSQGAMAEFFNRHTDGVIFFAGAFLGVFVTLSSVGAGAFCAAILMVLYPRMPALHIIGTDISHAVPLTLIAGLGHLILLGNVDFILLACLLVGSLPAIQVGTRLAALVPGRLLQTIIATLLFAMGVRFAVF